MTNQLPSIFKAHTLKVWHAFKQRARAVFAQRLALRDGLLLSALLTIFAATLAWHNGLGRFELMLYDKFIEHTGSPARDDIIIVAIDDISLTALGRWPWSRRVHAELLNRISTQMPKAIGLDLIFNEAENNDNRSNGDALLAQAIHQAGNVVLPVLVERGTSYTLFGATAIPLLSQQAAGLGHIHLEVSNDGVARSVFLREGMHREWLHFVLTLMQVAKDLPSQFSLPGQRAPLTSLTPENMHDSAMWLRDYQIQIPFTGPPGHHVQIPYISVLRGEAPPDLFRNKYVLVGATAAGLADAFPTPVSGEVGAMPGVEIHANILSGLLSQKNLTIAQPWQTALFCALPVLLSVLINLFFAPRLALLITLGLIVSTPLISFLFFHYAGVWLAPGAALAALVLVYPLWSWRRLEAAITYLGEEFKRLDAEPHLLPEDKQQRHALLSDALDRRISAMRVAATRVRDLRQFVSDSLNSLPDATLVTTTDGYVLLHNSMALRYFSELHTTELIGAQLPYLFSDFSAAQIVNQPALSRFEWWDLLDQKMVETLKPGVEAQDSKQRDQLIKSAPCFSAQGILIGWIVSLIDLTALHASEKSRDETLRFLSHDMRAPQAAILALLELQKDSSSALSQENFHDRIERYAQKTLGLADNFVQLAKAESQEYKFEEVSFAEMLHDACDEMWTLAQQKSIAIKTDIAEDHAEEFYVWADRVMLSRALVNLLSNAIKYSPARSAISCGIKVAHHMDADYVTCEISDQGYGISEQDQTKLFRKFQRFDLSNPERNEGIGLGLVFVKTVVEKHNGHIHFSSTVGKGTRFSIVLPSLITSNAQS